MAIKNLVTEKLPESVTKKFVVTKKFIVTTKLVAKKFIVTVKLDTMTKKLVILRRCWG